MVCCFRNSGAAFAFLNRTYSVHFENKSLKTTTYAYPPLFFGYGPIQSAAAITLGCSNTRWPIKPAGFLCSIFVCWHAYAYINRNVYIDSGPVV